VSILQNEIIDLHDYEHVIIRLFLLGEVDFPAPMKPLYKNPDVGEAAIIELNYRKACDIYDLYRSIAGVRNK
jgi:hypothetical protein